MSAAIQLAPKRAAFSCQAGYTRVLQRDDAAAKADFTRCDRRAATVRRAKPTISSRSTAVALALLCAFAPVAMLRPAAARAAGAVAHPVRVADEFSVTIDEGGGDVGGGDASGPVIVIPIPLGGWGGPPKPKVTGYGTVVALAAEVRQYIDQVASSGGAHGHPEEFNARVDPLRAAQTELPPNEPRPVTCYDQLIGAWVFAQRGEAAPAHAQSQRAMDCYVATARAAGGTRTNPDPCADSQLRSRLERTRRVASPPARTRRTIASRTRSVAERDQHPPRGSSGCDGQQTVIAPRRPAPMPGMAVITVAFEPLGYGTPRPHHAVLIVQDGGKRIAFEGHYSGTPGDFGSLVARARDLTAHPLKAGSVVTAPRQATMPGPQLISELRQLEDEVNRFHVPYNPTPALLRGTANSNTFVYSTLVHLGIPPPPAPGGTFGYFDGIRLF